MFEESELPSIKEDLVNLASSYCRKITSYALLEDIKELQGMCFSAGELFMINDSDLVKICELILDKSITYRYDLEEYGISETSIISLQLLTERFKTMVQIHQPMVERSDQN